MPFRILSLDGGGVRGIIAAIMLAAIEKQINQPLNKYFDLIAGTSTGSLLAAAIATGRSSQEMIDLYRNEGLRIFPYQSRWTWQRFPLLFKHGISAPKFSQQGLVQVLQETFGDTKFFGINSPRLIIISYDTIEREVIVFKSWRQDQAFGDIPLWEACLCSASAPTYFPAHRLEKYVLGMVKGGSGETLNLDDNASSKEQVYQNRKIEIISGKGAGQVRTIISYRGYHREAQILPQWEEIPDETSAYKITTICSAIDGGVAANNPSSCAVAEALRLGYNANDIFMLSLGTGDRTRIISHEEAYNWGLIQWAQPLIGVLFDGSSNVYEYISRQILSKKVLRLQFKLDQDLTGKKLSDDLDNATRENLDNLVEATYAYLEQPKVKSAIQDFLHLSG